MANRAELFIDNKWIDVRRADDRKSWARASAAVPQGLGMGSGQQHLFSQHQHAFPGQGGRSVEQPTMMFDPSGGGDPLEPNSLNMLNVMQQMQQQMLALQASQGDDDGGIQIRGGGGTGTQAKAAGMI